jgi:hypothetical protein
LSENIEVAVAELLYELNEGLRRKRIRVRRIKSPSRVTRPYKNQRLVNKIGNIEFRIWNNDHPPPHFHAISQGHFDVRVSIETGTVLSEKRGKIRTREKKIIESWAKKNNELLLEMWEESRPTEIHAKLTS